MWNRIPVKLKGALIIFGALILLIAIYAGIKYFVPVQMLPKSSEEIASIYIFDGSSGRRMTVTDPDVIEYIVGELEGHYFKCTGLRLGMGTSYHLTFSFESELYRKFILEPGGNVTRRHFSYAPIDGKSFNELFSYLDELLG